MKKNILIIEDEKPNVDRLKRFITELRPVYNGVGILESVSESISWLQNNETPHLLLLDIRLADGLSFEIFERIKLNCPIIFTTAYDEYAVRAFKFNSVDYLLKPVDKDELGAAFEKLENQQSVQPSVEDLLSFMKRDHGAYRSRFLLPYRDGYKTLALNEIEYFFSEHKITHAKLLLGGDEVLPQSMEELEQQLDPKHFFRANRQFIIHIDAIGQIVNSFNGKLKVTLKKSKDVEIIISRDKAPQFKAWMNS